MILRTFRDVETALRKLQDSINSVPEVKSAGGLNEAAVIALVKQYANRTSIINTTQSFPEDIDSSNHGGVIIHNLVHRFLQEVQFDGPVNFTGPVTGLPSTGGGNPFTYIQIQHVAPATNNWRISNESTEYILATRFISTGGGARQFSLELVADVNINNTIILFPGQFGVEAARTKKAWLTDLSVLPSTGPAPAAGYILAAKDTSGNVEWKSAPTPGSQFSQQAFATGTQNYGTSGVYSDVTGCSVSITAGSVGKYLVIASIVTQMATNDLEFHIRALQNQPGAFFVMSGEIMMQQTSGVLPTVTTVSYTWPLTVSTTPCTVKLEKMKVGTGTSFIFNESSITVIQVS